MIELLTGSRRPRNMWTNGARSAPPFNVGGVIRTRWVPAVAGRMRANYEQLLRRLKVLPRARSEALVNRPARQDRGLDVTQLEIISEVEVGANVLQQFGEACLDRARGFISSRMPEAFDAEALQLEGETALQRAELKQSESLTDLYASQERMGRHLQAYRREHERTQPAAYAENWDKVHVLLMFIWALETALNSAVFSLAGGGLTRGIWVAAGVSAINLFLGLVTGIVGVRLLWHVRPWRKWAGGLATVGGVGVALAFNYYIAVVRQDLEQQGQMNLGQSLARTVSSGGFIQLDMMSVCLLLIGLGAYIIAVFKGGGGAHTYLDPYWGYRAVERKWRAARADYDTARSRCIEALTSAQSVLQARLEASLVRQFEDLKEIRTIAAEGVERAGEVADSIAEWQDMGATLLAAYRDENTAVRGDEAPAYFKVRPKLRSTSRKLPDGQNLVGLSDSAGKIYEANVKVAAGLARHLSTILAEKLRAFDTYITEIEARGRRRVEEGPQVAETRPAPETKNPNNPDEDN